MDCRYISFILFFICLFSECFSKRDFMMKIARVECISRTPVLNISCTETKSKRIAGLNIFFTMTEDVYEMSYDLEVKYKRKNGQWEKFFKFNKIDVCEFVAAKFTVPILLIARNLMRSFSNYPEECPFKKDVSYYVQRMKFDPEQFPPYFPEGEFAATGHLYNTQYTFLDFTLVFAIVWKKHEGEKA